MAEDTGERDEVTVVRAFEGVPPTDYPPRAS